jgi:hypothetical protein
VSRLCARGRCRGWEWSLGIVAVVFAATLFSRSVEAQPTLRQECTALSRDDSAQVEARLLSSLFMRSTDDMDVSITCDRGIATASASSGSLEARRSVTLSGPVSLEAIVTLAEGAISAVLASAAPAQAPASASFPVTPPAGRTATDASGAPASPRATIVETVAAPKPVRPEFVAEASARVASRPRAIPAPRTDSNMRADASMETWGLNLAAGATLGLEHSSEEWSYAVIVGSARGVSAQPLFRVSEWTAAGELGWQPPGSSSVRLSARLGMSLLVVDPKSGVAATSSTVKSAAFAELDVSRPIWFGRLGLAPGLGVRFFSARRTVAVDGQQELQLEIPSARALLTLLFRLGA